MARSLSGEFSAATKVAAVFGFVFQVQGLHECQIISLSESLDSGRSLCNTPANGMEFAAAADSAANRRAIAFLFIHCPQTRVRIDSTGSGSFE